MATSSDSPSTPSKTDFVRDYLEGNPKGGVRAVNDAWVAAGHEGTISDTLVHRTRAEKGLTGNLRPTRGGVGGGPATRGAARKPALKPKARRGRPPRASAPAGEDRPAPAAAPRASRVRAGDLEAEFDRLLFRVMDQGMPDVEEAIRQARRLLVLREGR